MEKGFTVTEVLIVLLIIFVSLAISLPLLNQLQHQIVPAMTFAQLKGDLYYAQSVAINRQQRVQVLYSYVDDRYLVRVPTTFQLLTEQTLPPDMDMYYGSLTSIDFLPNGNVSRFGTVTFRYQDSVWKLTTYIGKGRFRVQKQ
jgi:competence protein ComGD